MGSYSLVCLCGSIGRKCLMNLLYSSISITFAYLMLNVKGEGLRIGVFWSLEWI
jgi:hypothetical protein